MTDLMTPDEFRSKLNDIVQAPYPPKKIFDVTLQCNDLLVAYRAAYEAANKKQEPMDYPMAFIWETLHEKVIVNGTIRIEKR